jgi:hypothetical protein
VPVAEAVIRACKTRTRPIVITALALVAGSSVIFTDPIFQGMAISLSSGVLVSTILTLIVIPLGCVAASRDLCEVAVASAPPGSTVPCAEELLEETSDTVPQRQREPSPVLAKIGGALMMVFYLIRGIFLLLYDWLKGLLRRRSGPTGPSGGGSSGGAAGGSKPSGGGDAGGIAYDQRGPSSDLRNALRTGDSGPDGSATVAPAPEEVGARTAATPPPDTDTVRPATVAKTPNGGKRATKKVATKKTAAATPKVAKVQKKAGRRGIRLKTGEDENTFD